MRILVALICGLFTITGCTPPTPAGEKLSQSYTQEIREWHEQRNQRLNQPDGWLTLSGLFWLEQGVNPFGGDPAYALRFPASDLPQTMGSLVLQGDSVTFAPEPGVQVQINGKDAFEVTGLRSDAGGEPDMLTWGSLSWYIIKRGERIGVRLKDAQHPSYVNFIPTELFPIDTSYRVRATLEILDSTHTVEIVNALGDASPNASPGLLHFMLNGASLTLTPLADPGDESYFIIFGDATNGLSTYGAGRFLVVPAVDENNQTIIDFNRAYNMPCVFSPYATCPLPPPENILAVKVEAGEKDYKHGVGH